MAHVIAAALVILIEAVQDPHNETVELLRPVHAALAIFESYASCSDLAKKGIVVLRSLIQTIESPSSSNSGDEQLSKDFAGSAGKDLKRAVGILKRKRGLPDASVSSVTTWESTSSTLSPTDGMMAFWDSSLTTMDMNTTGTGDTDGSNNYVDTAFSEDLFDTLFGLNNDGGLWDDR